MKFSALIFFSFIMLASLNVFAKNLEFKPLSVDVLEKDNYLIKGFKGRVKMTATPGAKTLQVTLRQVNPSSVPSDMREVMDEWLFAVQRNESTIEIVVRSPHLKSSWERTLKTQVMPSFEIDIKGPARPIRLAMSEGKVLVENWNAPLAAFIQKGEFFSRKTQGDFNISVQEGNADIAQHTGALNLESYSGKLIVKETKGPLSLVNFMGLSDFTGHTGSVELSGYQGTFSGQKVKGRVEFDVDRSTVKLNPIDGQLRGKSQQGPIIATLEGESEVRINTVEGNVSLGFVNSGAQLSLTTDTGQIVAPSFLNVARNTDQRSLRGRLKGSVPGQVYVKSQSGSIRIR